MDFKTRSHFLEFIRVDFDDLMRNLTGGGYNSIV